MEQLNNVLPEQVSRLQKEIRKSIDALNSGGCINFAYYFSKKLRELNIDHKVVFTDYDKINFTYKKFAAVSHVLIYVDNIGWIDGEETYTNTSFKKNYVRQLKKIPLVKLNNLRSYKYGWNNWYEKSQDTKLEKLINKHIYA